MPESYTIGAVAKQAGVNVETVRYYQRRGLVGEPLRTLGGIRRYSQAHVRRLRFIRQGQALGFSLEEVKDLLALEDGKHCSEADGLDPSNWRRYATGWRSYGESSMRSRPSSTSVAVIRAKCAARSSRRWRLSKAIDHLE